MISNIYNAAVVDRIDVTSSLVLLFVKPDDGVPSFEPGQYTTLGLLGSAARPADFPPEKEAPAPDKIIKRAYSVGSPPSDKNHLELCLAILPEGQLTSRLALIKPGDRLFCAKKVVGTFTLHAIPKEANVLMVATGTGIAPFMSMVRDPATWTPGRKITLIHGVRYNADLVYRQELLDLANTNPLFSYHATVSREELNGQKGYVQALIEKGVVSPDSKTDHVLLCGNPAMIDDMEKILLPRGYSVHTKKNPGNLHHEKYW